MSKYRVYIDNGILFIHKEEWNSAVFDNLDEPSGHYAMLNKSDRDRGLLCDITYICNLQSWTRL